MLSDKYLLEVVSNKDADLALEEATVNDVVVSWAICDGALVIHDCENPPEWFKFARDDDGNSLKSMESSTN